MIKDCKDCYWYIPIDHCVHINITPILGDPISTTSGRGTLSLCGPYGNLWEERMEEEDDN